MKVLGIDFETFSSTDIQKCGSFRYMDDPTFEILLMAYAYDDEEPVVIDLTAGEKVPDEVVADLFDPTVTKTAWNCAFERYAIRKHWGRYTPPEQWEDTMILAGQCGLPMTLKGACEAIDLGEDEAKMKEGKSLIQYFCKPCKPTKANGGRTRNYPEHAPEKWDVFKKYNGMDVVSERAIRKRLEKYKPLPEEHKFWCLDARINERGVLIDKRLAQMAVAMDAKNKDELTETAVEITGLDNPKSVSQVKAWLYDQEGKQFPSLNKKVIAEVVSQLQSDKAKEFMAIRSELSKSSTSKYAAMLRSMSPDDDHVRGCFAFYGANRTGRFAGRLVQFQNLSKNEMECLDDCRTMVRNGYYKSVKALYGGVADTLSQLVRTSIIPEQGHRFLISDFSAIEARVTAWFAGEQWRLNTFASGGDIYCASASQMFHVPVVKHGENGHLRQKGKIAELALGYGGSLGALKAMGGEKMGLTDEEMQDIVNKWRDASPHIVEWWYSMEKCAKKSIARKQTVVEPISKVVFTYEDGILWMQLPSGRRLAYWGAKITESTKHPGKNIISYMGTEQQSKKWSRLETWGGKLVENCVQATARDCLREAMFALDEAGYDIRMHVHDEVIVTEPISSGRKVDDMSVLMSQPIPWAPDLLLRADGYEGDYYFKD